MNQMALAAIHVTLVWRCNWGRGLLRFLKISEPNLWSLCALSIKVIAQSFSLCASMFLCSWCWLQSLFLTGAPEQLFSHVWVLCWHPTHMLASSHWSITRVRRDPGTRPVPNIFSSTRPVPTRKLKMTGYWVIKFHFESLFWGRIRAFL